ncbi:MAG: 4a-hydroxytetrahydrobiopterin dehydratase [Phycisphaerae bacterium]|nr:4a-hydroxytetrahydrobiopterin dehydratase [Phycisphaerae bacterium]
MATLSEQRCKPCREGGASLKGEALKAYAEQLNPDWDVVDEHHLRREFRFDDFRQALAFVNRVGELAEQENHHPDIYLGYGRVRIDLWTHKIGGLHENDFVLAAKIDRL